MRNPLGETEVPVVPMAWAPRLSFAQATRSQLAAAASELLCTADMPHAHQAEVHALSLLPQALHESGCCTSGPWLQDFRVGCAV